MMVSVIAVTVYLPREINAVQPLFRGSPLRWPNTVCACITDSVSDGIKHALGLW